MENKKDKSKKNKSSKKETKKFLKDRNKKTLEKKSLTKKESQKELTETQNDRQRYFSAIGRRKTAAARIRLYPNGSDFLVNKKPYSIYFPTFELQQIARSALEKMECLGKVMVSAVVKGGGIRSQAEAVRHGISRALAVFNPEFRKRLKSFGFLTRDPRMRERKKFGLKRARRAPQWQKR